MPSFTLLGPKVIRLPFILYSSYPHEILHNWWGNGVYPDYHSGNWSEGLTASRHSPSSEAVGYGKALMLFHMLRLRLGDELFIAGLRKFYRDHRFERATFDDIRRSFETVSGEDLKDFFRQWTTRTGAPQLKLNDAGVTATPEGGYRLRTVIEQRQPEAPYRLRVPLVVTLEGEKREGDSAGHFAGSGGGENARGAAIGGR